MLALAQTRGLDDQDREDVALGLGGPGQPAPTSVSATVQELGAGVLLDQQRGDGRDRQHPGQGHHQPAIVVQPDRADVVAGGAGEGLLQGGAQLLLASL